MVSLDSSFIVDYLRGSPSALGRLERLEQAKELKWVTPPAAAEVMVGAQRIGGRPLAIAEDLLSSLHWLEFDWESCRLAGQIGADLVAQGTPLGAADLFIAAISLRHGQRLLTRDRGFARVRGLHLETY